MIDPFKKVYLSSLIALFLVFNVSQAENKKLRCTGEAIFINEKISRPRAYAELINHDLNNLEIPLRFDAREKWPYCKSIKRIKKQGDCGACWAFATTSVIADRICIASKGKYDLDISIQDLIQCCDSCTPNPEEPYPACRGGRVHKALEWFVDHGLVTEGCKPLEKNVTRESKYTLLCEKKCTNPKYSIPYKKDKWYGRNWVFQNTPGLTSIRNIQAELMLNGPMVIRFVTFHYMDNLLPGSVISYRPDLILPTEKNPGAHAVKLIGWDVSENRTPVWTISNSWGENWCDQGFCSLERGLNPLAYELHMMMAVVPRLKNEEKEENKTKPDKKTTTNENSGSSNHLFRMYRLSTSVFICCFKFFKNL